MSIPGDSDQKITVIYQWRYSILYRTVFYRRLSARSRRKRARFVAWSRNCLCGLDVPYHHSRSQLQLLTRRTRSRVRLLPVRRNLQLLSRLAWSPVSQLPVRQLQLLTRLQARSTRSSGCTRGSVRGQLHRRYLVSTIKSWCIVHFSLTKLGFHFKHSF